MTLDWIPTAGGATAAAGSALAAVVLGRGSATATGTEGSVRWQKIAARLNLMDHVMAAVVYALSFGAGTGFVLGAVVFVLPSDGVADCLALAAVGIALAVEGAWTVHGAAHQPWLWPFRRRGEHRWYWAVRTGSAVPPISVLSAVSGARLALRCGA